VRRALVNDEVDDVAEHRRHGEAGDRSGEQHDDRRGDVQALGSHELPRDASRLRRGRRRQ
jgi:hypothetical protein